MSRIRSIKPEWLEDELLALASPEARVLSIALILLADDYGNGRANHTMLAGRVFPGKVPETLANALGELASLRYLTIYEVDGQHYYALRNWSKHQRVDKPGSPKVPGPPSLSCDNDSGIVTSGKVLDSSEKVPVAAANVRASRASLPLPDPDPIPSKAGRPTDIKTALRIPIQERSKLLLENPHDGEYLQPEAWPEVAAVAKLMSAALGQPVALGGWPRDRGVRAVVECYAAGLTQPQLAQVAANAKSDPWWQKGNRGLSAMTLEVVRRTLAQGAIEPDTYQASDF